MERFKYIYGPVPSRRLGLSLGISPIPSKSCNFSCVYCQLGRTKRFQKERACFFNVSNIMTEYHIYSSCLIKNNPQKPFDIITIVGEGEPTLYKDLSTLIKELKQVTDKPVAVITNSSLMSKPSVSEALLNADIILPSFDFTDNKMLIKLHRPCPGNDFDTIYKGLCDFSAEYKGEIWIETMLVKGINDSEETLVKLKELLKKISYSRLYINVPVRPPAEKWVQPPERKNINLAINILQGTSIEYLVSEGFASSSTSDLQALLEITKRHPMNQHEIIGFLQSRHNSSPDEVIKKMAARPEVSVIEYMGYKTYRTE
jgi:wyosine [tRNA(Phe)-imidazoG37] synthetase (radical SAM superfamily)